jgi:hypothetical protein
MPRSLALVTLALLAVAPARAQVLDDTLVPRGAARLEVSPVFTSWDSRFGRSSSGETRRERLGDDLTSTSAHALFPGAESLRSAIVAMSGSAGYTPMVGATSARVTQDITRIELGTHLGVFDWLTVGAVLPWTRTRTNLDVHFRPDTLGGDLGRNPTATNSTGVTSFLQAVGAAEAAAQANASQVCATSPGSGACSSAQALADRATSFLGSAVAGYGASAFFPVASSSTATALSQAVATLSSDLAAAGLTGIAAPMPFATQWMSEPDLWLLPSSPGAGLGGTPLGSVKGLWHAGDVEVSATVRVLAGEVRNAPDAPPSLTYRLLATALGRLPTGQVDSVDVFLDLGTGDGQADLEARVLGELTLGTRLGVQLGARYGVQRPRTLLRRVAPPEVVLAPATTRQLVEWTPGTYFGIEIAPMWRISRELSVAAEYRAFRKYRDDYELSGSPLATTFDPSVLEVESGITLHELGGTLRYDTLARWLGEGSRPLQVNFRVIRAVAGGGGQTPVTTQVELGVSLFRRIWGGS